MGGGSIGSVEKNAARLIQSGFKASKFGLFRYASIYGVKAYSELQGLVKGAQVHHIIEKRFAKLFPEFGKMGAWSSIVLTKAEHVKFNTLWRREIGLSNWKTVLTTTTATRADVLKAARIIYKNTPEILKYIPSH